MTSLKTIQALHSASYAPMDDLVTYTALPIATLKGQRDFKRFDPFLVLNHHGFQIYPPHNQGLPFGPHPHRGMETLTFIYHGDLTHRDSTGTESVIKAGGVQWMTAGRGIIHEEVSSQAFKDKGGPLEVIQVWFNLPAAQKMTAPAYFGLQKDQIPEIALDNEKVLIHPIAGLWENIQGPVASPTISIASLELKKTGKYSAIVSASEGVLLYVVAGEVLVNGKKAAIHDLVEFKDDGEQIEIEALEDSILIFGHGKPTQEPIVAYGPFVMNSEREIQQAYDDYRAGLFGR